jgi:hypothetical protein
MLSEAELKAIRGYKVTSGAPPIHSAGTCKGCDIKRLLAENDELRARVKELSSGVAQSALKASIDETFAQREADAKLAESFRMRRPSPIGPLHGAGWNEAVDSIAAAIRKETWPTGSVRPPDPETPPPGILMYREGSDSKPIGKEAKC